MIFPTEPLTEEHFTVSGGPTRHAILDRLYERQDNNNNHWVTVGSRSPPHYFIWRSEQNENKEVLYHTKDIEAVQCQWEEYLKILPELSFDDDGFFISADRLGPTIEIIPKFIRSFNLPVDKWRVELKFGDGWETVRFTVTGKQRIEFMQMFAKLDEPMTIKFDNWEFVPWS